MAKRKRNPTQQSAVKRDLFTAKYRQRVVPDKTKYNRKRHKRVSLDGPAPPPCWYPPF